MVIEQLHTNGRTEVVPDRQKALLLNGDPPSEAAGIARLLETAGFDVESRSLPANILDAVSRAHPRVILIHVRVLDDYALSICRQLREAHPTPVVICSTSAEEWDIVRGLEAGADEYLVVPLRALELAARLRAVIRRVGDPEGKIDRLFAAPFELRLDEHRVYRDGEPIELTPTEFRLLASLIKRSGQALSHTELLTQGWGPEYASCRHYLRMYMRYLRAKVEEDPQNPTLIVSEWGYGYRFEPVAA